MAKPRAIPVNPPTGVQNQRDHAEGPEEPLSGSKTVKNRNHSRHNHGEGS